MNAWGRYGIWAGVALLLALGLAGQAAAQPPAKTVALIVDYGDGVQKHFARLPWREEMTVRDATLLAAAHPRGIAVVHRGAGPTAFVTQIDDLKNSAAGGWTFLVNGQLADRGMGVVRLAAGDTVLWRFGKDR